MAFIGEVFTVISAWNFSKVMAIISAAGVILTAGYILWALQRVYLGPEYKGPHADEITPINNRELLVGVTLLVSAIVLGVYPRLLFDMMEQSTTLLRDSMAAGLQKAMSAAGTVQASLGN